MEQIYTAWMNVPLWLKVVILCMFAVALMFFEAARAESHSDDEEDYDENVR